MSRASQPSPWRPLCVTALAMAGTAPAAAASQTGSPAGHAMLVAAALLAAVALALSWRRFRRHEARRDRAGAAMAAAAREATALLRLATALQRCQDREEVRAAMRDMAPRVLRDLSGSLHLLPDDGGNAAEPATWGADGAACAASVRPAACRVLTRGRLGHGGTSRCCSADALCIPVGAGTETHGLLRIAGAGAGGREAARRQGLAMAEALSLTLSNLALIEALRSQAMRDPLTGLYNRRALEDVAAGLAQGVARRAAPLAVAMIDIDHFKQLNDRHGHAIGDSVLRAFGQLLRTRLRGSDLACRYGGEEFLVLLPDCGAADARDRIDALRRLVAGGWDGAGPFMPRFTLSAGVAEVVAGETVAQAVWRADGALYAAKQAGRNRVAVARPAARRLASEAA